MHRRNHQIPYDDQSYRKLTNLAIGLLILVFSLNTQAAKQSGKKAKHVIIAPVVSKQISDRIDALGTAKATESVTISSNVTEKIKKINFKDGETVRQGQILAVLEQDEEHADLKRAEAMRSERELTLQRLRKLKKGSLTTQEQIDRARFELEQIEASITAIKTRINDRIIRAPFDGIVGLRDISVGALIQTGDPIATLDDIHEIKLDFSVPSVFISEIKSGQKIVARAAALNDKEFIGEVRTIDSRVNPITRTIKVRALLPNPDANLLPGVLMQVQLLRNTRQALVIPEAALLPLADKQYVMLRIISNDKQTVEKRQVKTGLRVPGYVEILSGLTDRDHVVTHGNSKVRPGDTLDVMAIDDGNVDIADIIKRRKKDGQGKQVSQP